MIEMHTPLKWLTQNQYDAMAPGMRGLNWAGYYANLKVREIGVNAGPLVERFLSSVGLGRGFAWCAAFVYHCLKKGSADRARLPNKWRAAAVRRWVEWAEVNDRLSTEPKRGDLMFWLNPNGQGHIEFVREAGDWDSEEPKVETIGGNTNKAGSREGDGVYRKVRTKRFLETRHRYGFITLGDL